MTDLDRLAALAEKATPGPWEHGPLWWEIWQREVGDYSMTVRVAEVPHAEPPDIMRRRGVWSEDATRQSREPDAAYIAAADPGTVLALIAVARAARAFMALVDAGFEVTPTRHMPGAQFLRTALRHLEAPE
jgi:hypothetical protein